MLLAHGSGTSSVFPCVLQIIWCILENILKAYLFGWDWSSIVQRCVLLGTGCKCSQSMNQRIIGHLFLSVVSCGVLIPATMSRCSQETRTTQTQGPRSGFAEALRWVGDPLSVTVWWYWLHSSHTDYYNESESSRSVTPDALPSCNNSLFISYIPAICWQLALRDLQLSLGNCPGIFIQHNTQNCWDGLCPVAD